MLLSLARSAKSSRNAAVIGLLAMIVLIIGLLAACSGSKKSSSASSPQNAGKTRSADTASLPAADSFRAPAELGPSVAPAAKTDVTLQQRDFVRTATLSLQVSDVDKAADAIIAGIAKVSGLVQQDQRATDAENRTAHLVVRLPPDRLQAAIVETVKLGREIRRTIQGEDVTAAHADVSARVLALRTSVARLRDFLKHSGSINDLVSLEKQLTARESELESTQAQQTALENQIAQATLTVDLSLKPIAMTTTHHNGGPAGFGSAITTGWHGFVVSLRWIAAMLGYGLPFLLIGAALAAPAVLWLRRHRRSGRPISPAADRPELI